MADRLTAFEHDLRGARRRAPSPPYPHEPPRPISTPRTRCIIGANLVALVRSTSFAPAPPSHAPRGAEHEHHRVPTPALGHPTTSTMTTAAFLAPTPVPRLHSPSPSPCGPPATAPVCALQSPRPPPPPPARLLTHITSLTVRVRSVKCPFWRRRLTDALEATRDVLVWALRTRHKSLPLPLPPAPPSPSDEASAPHARGAKRTGLPIGARVEIIRDDFVTRQYYVTGRLSSALYRDDCLFDGPDPDGRVRGTRKFCDAASGLFDARSSRVDLIDVYAVRDERDEWSVVAEWRLEGVLKLPWRPAIKPYVGATTYRFDEEGLVCKHVESWGLGVVDAFVSVVVKGFGVPAAPPAALLRHEKLRDGTLHWRDGLDGDARDSVDASTKPIAESKQS